MRLAFFHAAVALLLLSACATDLAKLQSAQLSKIQTSAPSAPDTSDVDAYATRVLDGLQARSIAESREYCGFILRARQGTLTTSQIRQGGEDFCEMPPVRGNVIASFHTHGSFSPRYDNEVPSVDDVVGDFEARMDGYVATPGGRVWHIDLETGAIRQLCGPLCITSDPKNVAADAGYVPQVMSLRQLQARFGR